MLSFSRFLLLKTITVDIFECISHEFIFVLTVKPMALYMLNTHFYPQIVPPSHPTPSCILSLGCF